MFTPRCGNERDRFEKVSGMAYKIRAIQEKPPLDGTNRVTEETMVQEIKVGQIWEGCARNGFKRVRIVKVGEQPKRRRITYVDLNWGYTFTEYESTFRSDYGLI